MFNPTLWGYALKSITARKGRSLGLAAGLALGLTLFVALTTIAGGYGRLIGRPFKQLRTDLTIQHSGQKELAENTGSIRIPPANQPVPAGVIQAVRALPEIEVLGPALLLWDHSPAGFTVICGVNPFQDPVGPARVHQWIIKGRPLKQKGEVLLEKHHARINRLVPGQSVRLGGRSFKIVGLVELEPENVVARANVYMLIQDAARLAGLSADSSNMVFARLKSGRDPRDIRKKIQALLPGAMVSATDTIGETMKGFMIIFSSFSHLIGTLALAFSALVCYRLLSGSVQERSGEIGIMKTIGWRRRDISRVFTLEALLLTGAGGLAGLACGYLVAWLFSFMDITFSLPWNLNPRPSPGAAGGAIHTSLPLVFSIKTTSLALAVSLATGLISSWLASRKISKIKAMDSIREL